MLQQRLSSLWYKAPMDLIPKEVREAVDQLKSEARESFEKREQLRPLSFVGSKKTFPFMIGDRTRTELSFHPAAGGGYSEIAGGMNLQAVVPEELKQDLSKAMDHAYINRLMETTEGISETVALDQDELEAKRWIENET